MKPINENHNADRVAIAILHYLRDHPSAKDSATGIAKWWVGEERDVVEKALALLIHEGAVEKRSHLYQLKQDRLAPDASLAIEKTLRRLRRRK